MHDSPDLPDDDLADQLGPQLRAAFGADDVPPVGPALAEFVDTPAGAVTDGVPSDDRPLVVAVGGAAGPTTPRRKAMFTAFGAIAAKVALTASVTAAAATGAHAAGVVDLPGLPDVGERGESGITTASPTWTAVPLDGSPSTDPTLVPPGASTSTSSSTSTTNPGSSTSTSTSTSSSTSTSTSSSSTTVPIEFGMSTHPVAEVGAVVIEVTATGVHVVEVVTFDGWTFQISTDTPGEAEVYFRRNGERVDFEAEIDDGRLKIEVRDRRLEDAADDLEDEQDDLEDELEDADDDSKDEDDDDHDNSGSGSHDDRDDDDSKDEDDDDSKDDDDHDNSGSGSHDDDDDSDDSDDDSDDDDSVTP